MEKNNKTILITGASSGIGASFAKYLSSQGYKLIICGRDLEKLKNVNKDLKIEATLKSLDLKDSSQVKNFFLEIKKLEINLDGIVCSAGAHQVKPLRLTKDEDYLEMFKSNFLTSSNIISNFQKILNEGSSIVLISSAAAKRSAAAVSAYAAAKLALLGLVRSSALELAAKKIRVNMISPGVVETEMTKIFLSSIGDEAAESVRLRHPLGLGRDEDICGLLEFLISSKSSWITGQEIVIDGGFSIN